MCIRDRDLTDQDPKVSAIANAVWTDEVVTAYEAMIAEQEAEMNPEVTA